MLKVGDKVPKIKVKNLEGKDVSLEDFKGKRLIVYFYPKDDTPGCTKEACSFRDNNKRIQNTGTIVVGISPDDTNSHKKFIEKFNLPFNLLSDVNHKLAEAFGVWVEKSFFR